MMSAVPKPDQAATAARSHRRSAPSAIARMTAVEGLQALDVGKLSCEAWAQACLERIAERNPVVQAWIHVNGERALERARRIDREGRRTPLAGVPIGLKDIIDTADMPTELGDPDFFPGRQPQHDAEVARMTRELGFNILGKTTVSKHSIMLPGPCRNPHDPSRTPGASSAGSAASVADFMTPLAIGTQTGGSILRPSTFCGAVGYKPTIDSLPYAGLRRYSRPLDTVGAMARCVADLQLLMREYMGDPRFDPNAAPRRDFRVGVWRTREFGKADDYVKASFEENLRALAEAGVTVVELEVPAAFDTTAEDHDIVMGYDLARSFAEIKRLHHDRCHPELLEYLAFGEGIPAAQYAQALDNADRCRRAFYDVARDVDLIATPATLGEAPEHSYSGSNVFIRLWTLLHNPAITLPVARGPNGLPVGLQLIGFRQEDAAFLYWSRCVERVVGTVVNEV